MKITERIYSALIGMLLIAILIAIVSFIPLAPSFMFERNDPADITDRRVQASINNEELKEILNLVRGGALVSIWEYKTLKPNQEILAIINYEEITSIGSGTKRKKISKAIEGKYRVYIGSKHGINVRVLINKVADDWYIEERHDVITYKGKG
jgi:hypothetical protein